MGPCRGFGGKPCGNAHFEGLRHARVLPVVAGAGRVGAGCPAKEASVPNLVPKSSLTSANSLSMVAAYGTYPLGAGLLIVFAKMADWWIDSSALRTIHLDRLGLAFYFNALTFLVTAFIVWR